MSVRSIAITVTQQRLVATQMVPLPVAVTTDTPEMVNNVQVRSNSSRIDFLRDLIRSL